MYTNFIHTMSIIVFLRYSLELMGCRRKEYEFIIE